MCKNYSSIALAAALALLLGCLQTNAQNKDSIRMLTLSGYAETYYLYDFGEPGNHERPGFIYSHNRHNEVSLNLGYIKAAYATSHVRTNLALMAGTYPNANLAAEPGVLKNIYEANIGIRLSKTSDTWIDAGILPSHIGFESAVGSDCWTLTRSMMADNSPYYESGVKFSFASADRKWSLAALVLNGWQCIQRVSGNQTPAFGTQVTFQPGNGITLNSSTFIGNDKPDSTRQMRCFHNLYGIFQLSEKWAATIGFDLGAEQVGKRSSRYNTWYATALILKYKMTEKWSAAGRFEYFADKNGVIVAGGTPGGFRTSVYSLNVDCVVRENLLWRIEARGFYSGDEVFTYEGKPVRGNFSLATVLAIAF